MSDFGALKGLNDVVKQFIGNPNLFKKLYDDKNFIDFKIPKNNETKIETFEQKNESENINKNQESVKLKNKFNNIDLIEIKPILDNFEKFTDNDKAFIYNLCTNEKYKIPLTEKVKLLLISGEVNNVDIYEFSKDFDTFYSKVNKGIDYSNSNKKTLSFVEQFIEKIYFLNLKDTNEILASIRFNFISANKKALIT